MFLEEAIKKRRSIRTYTTKPLTLAALSQLLFAAQGITTEHNGYALRSAPSAGAVYPFDIYVIVNNVENVRQGIYRYHVDDHALELIKSGDFRAQSSDACLGQETVRRGAVTFLW